MFSASAIICGKSTEKGEKTNGRLRQFVMYYVYLLLVLNAEMT